MSTFYEFIINTERELTDQIISDALKYVIEYADNDEKTHYQITEIKSNLHEFFNSKEFNNSKILG